MEVIVIGGGLAGCEAAWQAAQRGVSVKLYEMRPFVETGAHAGADLAGKGVDLLVSVGPMGRYIALGAAERGVAVESFASTDEAAGALAGLLRAGDTVLIKGSRGMAMEGLLGPVRAVLGGQSDERPDG